MTDKAARSSFWTDVTRLPLGTTCTMEQVMRRGMSSTREELGVITVSFELPVWPIRHCWVQWTHTPCGSSRLATVQCGCFEIGECMAHPTRYQFKVASAV